MKTVDVGATIDVPAHVATCPYCEGALRCQPTAWEQEDDGSWIVSESGVDCMSEPDLEDDSYDDWVTRHTYMPYVYWMPVDLRVTDWINENFRYDLEAQ